MAQDPRIDAYIAACPAFARPILIHLRARMHAACPEVVEDIKWGMPFFLYRERPLANMAAFKAHASFGFWEREGLATGWEGQAMGQYGRLESLADLPDDATLQAQICRAMALIDSGAPPKRARSTPKPEAEVPPALAALLEKDAAASATFHDTFSPSQRREYCDWIAEAKRDETRDKRVAQAIEWLREGKQRNWKYMNC